MLMQLLMHQPQALLTIVQRTPAWVWIVLLALLGLGISQWRTRSVSAPRLWVMPLAMALLALWSLVSALQGTPHLVIGIGLWILGMLVFASLPWTLLRHQHTTQVRYDPNTQLFLIPGSPIPLVLIVLIFSLKYAVGVELAINPSRAHDGAFSACLSASYGVLNGIFVARAAHLLRYRYCVTQAI